MMCATLDIEELAARLKRHKRTIERWLVKIEAGEMDKNKLPPCDHKTGKWLCLEADFEAWWRMPKPQHCSKFVRGSLADLATHQLISTSKGN
ncbi:MAG: helix-turn-helix domain-containing protein [Gallionella sp.]|nr:helix-turn-helix domain-containing protein [Gallionella sp.]